MAGRIRTIILYQTSFKERCYEIVPRKTFNAYLDAVDLVGLLLMCTLIVKYYIRLTRW